jgi:hypothetical protein
MCPVKSLPNKLQRSVPYRLQYWAVFVSQLYKNVLTDFDIKQRCELWFWPKHLGNPTWQSNKSAKGDDFEEHVTKQSL